MKTERVFELWKFGWIKMDGTYLSRICFKHFCRSWIFSIAM